MPSKKARFEIVMGSHNIIKYERQRVIWVKTVLKCSFFLSWSRDWRGIILIHYDDGLSIPRTP
jgi:hypothetical protein